MTGRGFTADDLDRILGTPAESASLRAHLDAAAVLAAFDPLRLRPDGAGPDARPGLPDGLLARSVPVEQSPEAGRWALSLPERRAALRHLGDRAAMRRALDANPDRPTTAVQRQFERLIGTTPGGVPGTAAELAEMSRAELAALHTMHDWVDGILDGLPPRREIDHALSTVGLLAPMRRLTEGGFVGRVDELAELGRHVFAEGLSAPLFVHGPGGVGKSTLLARFVLDSVAGRDLPFAYLDLDRPTIRPDQPATLLLHALAQLAPQLGLDPDVVDALSTEISYAVGRVDTARQFESPSATDDSRLVDLFASVVRPGSNGRVLVVVDTFEEAQYLGVDVAFPLLLFLLNLRRALPGLRIVLSGRVLPEGAAGQEIRPMDLGDLDRHSARRLLRTAVGPAGGPGLDESELDDVIGAVGRNAICLRLAGRLLRDEGVAALRTSRNQFLTRLRAEKVQALLYGRILRHLHSDTARAVAYPGLVVRRIAPDVIRDVLAEPCGLELRPGHDEHAVFAELRAEAALVEVDPEDGSLRHRPDVRRAMLTDLTDHVAVDVAQGIDRAAVGFYEARTGPIARAEEIYHRLRLGEPDPTLDARWSPEAAPRLKSALAELAPHQQLWLAQRLGVTVDTDVRAQADQQVWEDHAAASAQRLLISRLAAEALDVLHERTGRLPRSALPRLEAEAYRLLDRPDEALAVARASVDAAGRAGAVDSALELLLLMTVIEEGRRRLAPAEVLVTEAASVAAYSTDAVLRFRVAVTRLRLVRRRRPHASDELTALRAEAAGLLTEGLLHALRAQPVLLREAAAELGETDTRLAGTAIETLGVEVAHDTQAQAFGHAIVNAAASSSIPLEPAFLEGAAEIRRSDYDTDAIRAWVTSAVKGRDTRLLGRSLAEAGSGTDVLRDFQEYFRAGVESTLRGPAGGDPSRPGGGDRESREG